MEPHPRRRHLLLSLVVLASVTTTGSPAPVPPCASFNASRIRLVTFDVFAALMDTVTSLEASVAALLPPANASLARPIVSDWVSDYGGKANSVFDPLVAVPNPFPYTICNGLEGVLAARGLLASVAPRGSPLFDRLVEAWGELAPWPGTGDVLAALTARGIGVAPLSNGDRPTLERATSVFWRTHGVNMSHIFSSDFPVGAFKPQARMYDQVLALYPAEEVLHFGGGAGDANGARAAGMLSGLVRGAPAAAPDPPCFELSDISQLLGATRLGERAVVDAGPTATPSPSGSPSGRSERESGPRR
jgi:phosphoglycolate phosphatase-like HAD superfamily hydrolase